LDLCAEARLSLASAGINHAAQDDGEAGEATSEQWQVMMLEFSLLPISETSHDAPSCTRALLIRTTER
jgi:hypothetical protein